MPPSLRSSSSTSASSPSTHTRLPSAAGHSRRSSSSSWKSEYLPLPRDPSLSVRFIAYAAGASLPTTVKKMTRLDKNKDGQSVGGGVLPRWNVSGRDTQLFWVVVPEDRQKRGRGRSRTSRERTQQGSRSAAASSPSPSPSVAAVPPEVNFPPDVVSSRGPRWTTGGSTTGIVVDAAGRPGVGGGGGAPVYGQPRPGGFSFGVAPVVGLPGGSMPSFGRKQTC